MRCGGPDGAYCEHRDGHDPLRQCLPASGRYAYVGQSPSAASLCRPFAQSLTVGSPPIADIVRVVLPAQMRAIIAFVGLAALAACHRAQDGGRSPETSTLRISSLPYEHPSGLLHGYLLQVPSSGSFTWNGSPVDAETLSTYLSQYSAAKGAGRLWIEFQPGMSSARKNSVVQSVLGSGICAQRRCVETDWNAKWQVVN